MSRKPYESQVRHTFTFERAASNGITCNPLPAQASGEIAAEMVKSGFRRGINVRFVVWYANSFDGTNLQTGEVVERQGEREQLTFMIRAGSL